MADKTDKTTKKKRTAKPKSAVMLAFETAKEGVKHAREAVKKADNEKTQAALVAARDALKTASAEAARERFISVGGTRVAVLLDKAKNVVRIANSPKSYTFTESDANEIVAAVNETAKEIETAFKKAISTTAPAGEKRKGFVFSSTKAAQ